MTKEFIEEQIGNARFKSAQSKFNAIGEKREGRMKEYSELIDRSNYFNSLADYLSQHPVMQEGEKIPSLLNPHEEDMVKLNQLMKDNPEWYHVC